MGPVIVAVGRLWRGGREAEGCGVRLGRGGREEGHVGGCEGRQRVGGCVVEDELVGGGLGLARPRRAKELS